MTSFCKDGERGLCRLLVKVVSEGCDVFLLRWSARVVKSYC